MRKNASVWHWRRLFTALFLVLCLLLNTASLSARADLKSDIDKLTQQKKELQAQKNEKQAVIDQLSARHAEVSEQKQAMDERNYYTLQEMQLNSEQIELYSRMIAEKSKEVDAARQLEDEQLQRYRERVRAMEENGDYDYLVLVLKAQNLAELLTTIDDVGEIMEYDRQIGDDYIAARENTEQVKAEYEAYKADIEAMQEELRTEQAELEAQIGEATELLYDLIEEIGSETDAIDELNESIQEVEDMIAELERQRAEEEARRKAAEEEARRKAAEKEARRKAAASGGSSGGSSGGNSGGGSSSVVGTGSFGWPVPSSTYITSRFGPRYHPITGNYQSTHKGLDIAAGYGENILAADSGTVYYAGYNEGGYGNYVMIDHGNGYITLYGHMTSYAVSKGQTVSKGDVIGYVGSTGMSTGPHCHFEIRLNGSVTDPAPWFSGLTYSASA